VSCLPTTTTMQMGRRLNWQRTLAFAKTTAESTGRATRNTVNVAQIENGVIEKSRRRALEFLQDR